MMIGGFTPAASVSSSIRAQNGGAQLLAVTQSEKLGAATAAATASVANQYGKLSLMV